MSAGCLYRLTFPCGKSYIGITRGAAQKRFAAHVHFARTGKRLCAVHHAILKYGADAVSVDTLAMGSWPYLTELEVRAIASFGTRPPRGYNLTMGGDGVRDFDEITRAKMGAANIGRSPDAATLAKLSAARRGLKRSEETRAKMRKPKSAEHRANMSAAQKGHVVSAATRERMRASHVGKKLTPEHCAKLSRPMPETTRAAIAAANIGRKHSPESIAKRKATIAAKKLAKGITP